MRISAWISALVLLSLSTTLHAESFIVEDIEVVGIKKITIGTVFSYLPINVGESLEVERTPELIRELYSTGFFDNIELLRRDDVLVIQVVERPSIAEVNFEGNDQIDDEALKQAMDGVNMSKGRIFDKNKLEKLELELQQVYYSLGKYSARIEADWRKLDEDRVAIDITISEGISATIKSINITGNQDFDEEDLLDILQLEPSSEGLFADDEYSSSKLAADLETLKSYYLDRGHIQFQVNSQQVTISPDRKDINITINIFEGEQFALDKMEMSGEMVVDETEMNALNNLRTGDIYSRKEVVRVTTAMQKRLGEDGYAFAEVKVLTDINEDDNTVSLRFFVLPGHKMRIRYISFTGNEKTQDLVLRRELRQLEGAMYQRSQIDRSKIRLQRLKYISSVDLKLRKVPDTIDQVDIDISVIERFSGNLQVGLGYSQVQGALLNLGFTHDNVFGSGNSVSLTFDNSAAAQRYGFRYSNPYYTADGVSRGFSFSLTETDASENNTSNFLIDRISASIDYGIPLSEYNKLGFRVGFRQNNFKTTSGSSEEVYDFLRDNSDKYSDSTPDSEIDDEEFNTLFTVVSLSKDTRNRRIFADSGSLNSINLELQGGDLYYYKWRYRHQSAFALNDTFTYNIKGRLGFGDGYNDTDDLPIYEKFYAGGVRSVRGYDFNSLGPLDSEGDAEGGNLQVITTNEIIFPLEALGSSDTFRVGLYFDAGNVFATADDYETDELRQSVGVSAKWLSFIGPLEFSYAFPLNDEDDDDVQEFQFALGAQF